MTMLDHSLARQTTVLLVDDDLHQLELRALVLKTSGFAVQTARCPVKAISLMAHDPGHKVDVAILDYHMPSMNGCMLADYLRERYPDIKIVLHSGAGHIPESEMGSVDDFVPKGEGVERLIEKVFVLAQGRSAAGAIAPKSRQGGVSGSN
jgi:CheY-like chemotaxis protein